MHRIKLTSMMVLASVFVPLVIGGIASDSMHKLRQVIVMSLPGESNPRYRNLTNIADLIIEMDGKTTLLDDFFVIHDKSGLSYLKKHTFSNGYLIEVSEALDLWMRDFAPVMPKIQVKFQYRPQYLNASVAKDNYRRFEEFAKLVGIELSALNSSDLVLEGGHVVENGQNIAVTTERIFKINKDMSRAEVIKKLEETIKRKVVVIPDPGDTTGHADGVVSFLKTNVLLVLLFDNAGGQAFFNATRDAVIKAFPSVKVVPLPSCYNQTKSNGFMSAEGSYANCLVTKNAVYLPFFSNQASNQKAFDVFFSNGNKYPNPVNQPGEIPALGGSLRRMIWQLDKQHPVARSLFSYIYNRNKPTVKTTENKTESSTENSTEKPTENPTTNSSPARPENPAMTLIIPQFGLLLCLLSHAFY